MKLNLIPGFQIALPFLLLPFLHGCGSSATAEQPARTVVSDTERVVPKPPALDTAAYDKAVRRMVNGDTTGRWPVKAPYPLTGAILPMHRVVAYYGNFYSRQMGILGELPKDSMVRRLKAEVEAWRKADPETPVIPALHYIAVTAQLSPGRDSGYRLRMPHKEIEKTLAIAREIGALVFIDIQVGHSTLRRELPEFERLLKMPEVHFGIDPEFSMKGGQRPGAAIGTYDAEDINYATEYLARIVRENGIPPKILVVHRFTQNMVTNYRKIVKRPEVQIVMDMDGWGAPAKKFDTYQGFIYREPVQFSGFKLFYKNDLKHPPHRLLTPTELLKLRPRPVYIQYQ
jgi:hypothetical protein